MKNNKQDKSLTKILTNTNINVGTNERIASAVGGGALLTYGLKRGDTLGVILSILGGGIALRGVTGHCQVYDAMNVSTNEKSGNRKSPFTNSWASGKIDVTKSVTINKSPEELYNFWRNFENLPKFMNHLESVVNLDGNRSHWKAKAPLGYSVEWDAELTGDQKNERISWRSLEGADIPNSGVVEFKPTSNRGTEVKVSLTYEAPAGKLGALAAKLFGEAPSQQVEEDLRRFKRLMEAGMNLKVEGQSSGRSESAKKAAA